MKKVLGLDISSTTIGWCILEIDEQTNNINFINASYLKPLKNGDSIERIVDTRNKIKDIIDKYKPDYIGIEDIIKFMKGKSSAQTIIMLTTYNRMTCLVVYDYLSRSPELFSVMAIRHGLKINKIFPKKEDMPELVAKHLAISFPYQLNKKNKIKVESYDMADGISVALYYAFILTGRIVRKVKKIKVKKK